jgi:hypothetical protein
MVVHLDPDSLGTNGASWANTDNRPITFTAGAGTAKPQLVSDGLGGLPATPLVVTWKRGTGSTARWTARRNGVS